MESVHRRQGGNQRRCSTGGSGSSGASKSAGSTRLARLRPHTMSAATQLVPPTQERNTRSGAPLVDHHAVPAI